LLLHLYKEDFSDLTVLTAGYINIPVSAIRRDYYIVMILQQLEMSEFADLCVFKGGTSLSKCYPGRINRFSEDIDLTFFPQEELRDKQYDRKLKQVEKVLSAGFQMEKITSERNNRNKSSWVWYEGENRNSSQIKLEIGSSVRPDPYTKKTLKTYIQEYLESRGMDDVVSEFELKPVSVNTLAIERTFIDKVMAVKRHAYCGTLPQKVRHIYDVTMLLDRPEIQKFLKDKDELKRLLKLTKETDSFYLFKRGIAKDYNPTGLYDFNTWKDKFDSRVKENYKQPVSVRC
jgi:predicted nucleotidyltransferase component of viral defense system